ncbi:hypothetical protein AB2L27_15455 [Kineococcus sp. LSe6-4]|uniref:YokE-like PH domain-containing protein n=1 Tax=Kineococcus halophytocola TaxID=3234027 RepID=A0ABV4H3J8_9ACTN
MSPTAHAQLLGHVVAAGEDLLAALPLRGGLVGGEGAIGVGTVQLWLSRPQLVGGASVAAVPLADVGAGAARERRFGGGLELRLVLSGREVAFATGAGRDAVEGFLRELARAQRTAS